MGQLANDGEGGGGSVRRGGRPSGDIGIASLRRLVMR